MSRVITFTAYGTPASQGSKVRTKYGMRESSKKLAPWRENVARSAAIIMYEPVLIGPVEVTCRMIFPRPKGHYGTGKNAGQVKTSAPHFVTTKPDIDKCLRAILDGITHVIVRDDSQVVSVISQKQYGEPARAEITVRELA